MYPQGKIQWRWSRVFQLNMQILWPKWLGDLDCHCFCISLPVFHGRIVHARMVLHLSFALAVVSCLTCYAIFCQKNFFISWGFQLNFADQCSDLNVSFEIGVKTEFQSRRYGVTKQNWIDCAKSPDGLSNFIDKFLRRWYIPNWQSEGQLPGFELNLLSSRLNWWRV